MKKTTSKPTSIKRVVGIPLATVAVNGGVCLLEKIEKRTENKFFLSWSTNGLDFSTDKREVVIHLAGKTAGKTKKTEKPKRCDSFSISGTPTGFVMTYIRKAEKSTLKKTKTKKTQSDDIFVVAKSLDLYEWHVKSELPKGDAKRATVVYDKPLDYFVLYEDGIFAKNQMTRTLVSWKDRAAYLFTSRFGMFDAGDFSIIGSLATREGLLILYDSSVKKGKDTLLQIGGVLFDLKNPKRIMWRSEVPLWQGIVESKSEKEKYFPIGFVYFQNTFMVYWRTAENNLILSSFPALFKNTDIYQYNILNRFEENPVIEPRAHHDWEIMGTFNPGVFQDEEGVHMFYRALGSDGISRIGYAKSKDGLSFERRLPHPVFEPSPDKSKVLGPATYSTAYYTSGGGWGGSEDPRAVKIGNRIYLHYVAFEGWHSVRIAVISISVDDFKNGRWHWRTPIFISPYGEVHKNWVIFPEKINGKFAVLHGLSPRVLVDYIDDLENFDETFCIKSKAPSGGREGHWDTKMRGAGPPPLKTDKGWLVFYHAHQQGEPHKYKLGAMLLDLNDPTKILYRSEHPILSPDMHYENEGKPGIVYASGAIIRGKDLYIYYGGGDRVVCIATTPIKEFLEYLITGKPDSYELKKVSTKL